MAKKKFSPLLFWLITNLGFGIVKLLGISLRCQRLNPLPTEKAIFAFWHRNIIPLMYVHRNKNYVVIISKSQDGDLITDVCEKLGYLAVRGSTSRGGSSALRKLIVQSKKYSLAFTPDGPKGPACKIKEGMVYLAKLTGLPLVLISAKVGHEIVFNSWDRFRLPLPFSRIKIIYDTPQYIAKDADIKKSIAFLEERMRSLELKLQ